jgi:hypothetical protein
MSSAKIEKDIITGLIVSDEFCKRIIPLLKEPNPTKHVTTPFAGKVAKWCIEYYDKYKKAPFLTIDSIFSEKKINMSKEEEELTSTFLSHISEEYENGEAFNINYTLDSAKEYFRRLSAQELKEKLSTALKQDDTDGAVQLVTDYKPPSIVDTEKAFEEGFTAKELKTKQLKEVKWFIDDVIPIGLTLMAGKAKTGKSYFLLNAAIDLALGRKAFDAVPTESEWVLFLALEEPPHRTKRRLGEILKNGEYPDKLYFFPIGTFPRSDQGGMEKLEQCMKECPGIRLIVIDTLAKWKRPKKAHTSDYDEDYQVMSQLHEFANKHEIAVVVIHHTKKTRGEDVFEEISGGMGIQAGADTLIVMGRVQGKPDHRVLSYRGRDIGEYDKVFKFMENGRWVLSEEEIIDYTEQSKHREIIKDYIEFFARPTIKRKELVDMLKNDERIGEGVDVILKKMVETGSIEKPDYGLYASRGYAEERELHMVVQEVREHLNRNNNNSKSYKGRFN